MNGERLLAEVRSPTRDSQATWRHAAIEEIADALGRSGNDEELLLLSDWAGRRLDDRIVPALLPLLGHANPEIRASAAEALGRIEAPSAALALAEALRAEGDAWVIPLIVTACGRCRAVAALPGLVRLLSEGRGHPDPIGLRRALATALTYLGEAEPSVVGEALRDAIEVEMDEYTRELLQRALNSLSRRPTPWPTFDAWRGDGYGTTIWYLAAGDGQRATVFDDGTLLGPGFYRESTDFQESSVPTLPVVAQWLQDLAPSSGRHKVLRRIFAVIDEPQFLELLASLSGSPLLRASVIRELALDALEGPHPALVSLLRDPHPRVRGEAFSALSMLAQDPEDAGLAAAMRSALGAEQHPAILEVMVDSIGASRFAALAGDVAGFLKSGDPVVRYGAAASLGRWRADAQRTELREAADREDWPPALAAMERALRESAAPAQS